MMSVLGLALVLSGALLVLGVTAVMLLRTPRAAVRADKTIAVPRLDDVDGEFVRIEGRVIVPEPVYAPSGRACAIVEIYAAERGGAARPQERRVAPFFIDDGMRAVRISPAVDLVAFDLPTVDLGDEEATYVERHLEPGSRVLVVGRVSSFGAPGHEEFVLVPAEGANCVGLTYLAPPTSRVNRSRTPIDGLPTA